MFYIRADANNVIATGHIMRCMSIAKEIQRLGEDVIFITADYQAKELIVNNEFNILCLDSKWDDLEQEISKLISVIKDNNITTLMIDSYYVTEVYLKKLRKYTKLIYLDDLASFSYPVDMLINYNIYSNTLGYERWANIMNTTLVLGCSYAPLREEFKNIREKSYDAVNSVLLTTGGADSFHIAYNFLKYLCNRYYENDKGTDLVDKDNLDNKYNESRSVYDKIRNVRFDVVIGKFNKDRERLLELSKQYPNLHMHMNVTNMSELMKSADIAITAGGSTMYELSACGVPMITYSIADNQLPGVQGFQKHDVGIYCGDIRNGEEQLWNRIIQSLVMLIEQPRVRRRLGENAKKVVDGYGAQRLTQIIKTVIQK